MVDQSRLVKGSVMAFDGFTGFTPIQNQLLRKLLTLAERTMVTVTCDVRENLFGAWREEDLFAMSKKMIRGLTDMARETGTELEDVIYCDGKERRRFVPGGYLQHLEQNLFRRRAVPFGGECAKGAATDDAADAIRIYSLASPRKELEFVASQICAACARRDTATGISRWSAPIWEITVSWCRGCLTLMGFPILWTPRRRSCSSLHGISQQPSADGDGSLFL